MLTVLKGIYRFCRDHVKILFYNLSGKKPWSRGYEEYKRHAIIRLCADQEFLSTFARNAPLPASYGFKMDERMVEYPWVLSRLSSKQGGMLLDAGSVLNFDFLLSNPILKDRTIYIYNLAPETVVNRSNISYIYGDLRSMIFKDEQFDEIVCVSTLEHVGMDNTFLYSSDEKLKESAPQDFLKVIGEFKRTLKAGGKLLITVPFGVYAHMGWLQQFDLNMVNSVVQTFKGTNAKVIYYQYSAFSWQISTADQCAHCRYFDIHKIKKLDPDHAAAARAIACIELTK